MRDTTKAAPAKRGPKPMHGQTMRRVLVMLDEESLQRARTLGRGNVSAGIRASLQRPLAS